MTGEPFDRAGDRDGGHDPVGGPADGCGDGGDPGLAFTDGLVEARSPQAEVFGGERLRRVAKLQAAAPASEIVGRIVEVLKGFSGQAEPHDDMTMLAAQLLA